MTQKKAVVTGIMNSAELEGWLRLSLTKGIGEKRLKGLISCFETPQQVFSASYEDLAATTRFDEATLRAILDKAPTTAVDQQLELLDKYQVKLLTTRDCAYPHNLRMSGNAPPLLFLKGAFIDEDRFSISVVGARQTTQYGRFVCERLSSDFARMGFTVVSGMAQGIDTCAHEAALKSGGRTVAVLGNGLDLCYPAANKGLMERIWNQGVVVSEFPMGTMPEKGNFPQRNATIAGLSLGVVVVEASKRSGALITAGYAVEDNRCVYAVPGDVNRQNSRGTNRLIQQGALLVTSAEDVVEDLSYLLRSMISESQPERSIKLPDKAGASDLSQEEQAVFDIVRSEPKGFDDICYALRANSIPIGKMSSLLVSLEVKGVITQLPGGIYTVV